MVESARQSRRRRRTEAERQSKRDRLEEQIGPQLVVWEVFHQAVGRLGTVYSRLRNASPEEAPACWNELEVAVRDSIAAARRLLEGTDRIALRWLRPLEAVARERIDPEQGWVAEHELRQWVLRKNAEYSKFRRRAGLPRSKSVS